MVFYGGDNGQNNKFPEGKFMRYAILSDIHSNLEALTAVLDELATQRIDRYLCLGDLIGYGADPEACLARLRGCDALSVCGNHEWACVGKLDVQWFNETAKRAVLWTRDRLSVADLDSLRRLPLVVTEGPCTLVHGTLSHPERFEYLVEIAQAVDTIRQCRTTYCLIGHTHIPLVYEYDLEQHRITRVLTSPEELVEVRVSNDPTEMLLRNISSRVRARPRKTAVAGGAPGLPGGGRGCGERSSLPLNKIPHQGAGYFMRFRYVVNPGSVGQPRDGDAKASCAILDTERQMLMFHRVAYDIPTAQRKIRQAGLPELFAERLAVGR